MKKIFSVLFAAAAICSFSAQAQSNTKMQVGQPAPELAFSNPKGQVVSLNKVNKGKYILLDFWASWCGPCRMSSPQLVAVYNKYKSAKFKNAPGGFTVFSVSLDNNKDSWLKAIAADNLSWEYHTSDLKKWESAAVPAYGLEFIPQAFLLGPDGKIVGKYQSVGQAVADLEKYLDKGNTAAPAGKKKTTAKAAATSKK